MTLEDNMPEINDKNINIPLVLNIEEDIKIPQDTVDNRKEIIDSGSNKKIINYGRPQLNLDIEELNAQQRKIDKDNLAVIATSFAKGEIDEEARHYLMQYYRDGTAVYEHFKESLNGLFGTQPKSIKYINLLTGDIDNDTPYFNEHVGPQNTMMYEYEINAPWRLENQIPGAGGEKISIKVIMPKMKSIERVLEKVRKGGKYDLERQAELKKLEAGQPADQAKLRTPIQKLKDVLRCTILAPRYDDITALYNYGLEMGKTSKSSRPSKYLDNDVKNAAAFFKNIKNYRDMKTYLHVPDQNGERLFGEVQYKTEVQFFMADIKTHLEYEQARKYQQMFYESLTEGDKKLLNTKIYLCLLNIQKLNSQSFERYNLSVLQDMRKMEDKLKASGCSPTADGTYPLCKQLLDKNLLVRSSMALMDNSFSKSPAWVRDIYRRYYKNIDAKYLVDLRKDKSCQR